MTKETEAPDAGPDPDARWLLWAHAREEPDGTVRYEHFYPSLLVLRLAGTGRPARVELRVSRTPGSPDTYWGFWRRKEDAVSLVYARRYLLEVCFPYGLDNARDGCAVPLDVREVPAPVDTPADVT
jgi:hypothetical protein